MLIIYNHKREMDAGNLVFCVFLSASEKLLEKIRKNYSNFQSFVLYYIIRCIIGVEMCLIIVIEVKKWDYLTRFSVLILRES